MAEKLAALMTDEELEARRRNREEMFKEIRKEDEHFPIPWREMTPEEFVARRWHCVGCCSLHRYTYEDDALNDWMARFGRIISSDELVEAARKSVLSPTEYEEVQKEIRLIEEHGL